jgi:ornithine carbamoyltransferase
MGLKGRSLLKDTDLSPEEFRYLVGLAARLREDKRARRERSLLAGTPLGSVSPAAKQLTGKRGLVA